MKQWLEIIGYITIINLVKLYYFMWFLKSNYFAMGLIGLCIAFLLMIVWKSVRGNQSKNDNAWESI